MAYELEQQQLADRLRRAQLLQQTQAPQGQMVSGHYVNPSITQYLAQGLRQYLGGKEERSVQDEQKALVGRREQAIADALRGFAEKSQGRPADMLPEDQAGPVRGAMAPDMQGAFAQLMAAPDPALRQAGMRGVVEMPQIQAQAEQRKADLAFRQEEAAATRQAREDQLKLAHQQRMELMQSQNASREQMAQAQREFQAQMQQERIAANAALKSAVGSMAGGPMGKPPAGYRFTPDGNLEAIPGGPAANKAGEKPLTEGQAKGSLYLGQMRSATEELGKLPSASPTATAAAGSTFTNWATPANAQKVAQLQNQWAEAYLRAKTGAAATEGEVNLNKRTFFPVVGDSAAVIQQKAKMREQAERDMVPVAGPGAANAGGGASGSWDAPAMPQGFKVVR